MLCSEHVENQTLVINDSEAELRIPIGNGAWGNPNITVNKNLIPTGRLWVLIAKHTAVGKPTPRPLLMSEAKRAALYTQRKEDMLVYTLEPQQGDRGIQGNVFMRKEPQRMRPLLTRFGIVVAKIEPPIDPESIKQMHEAAEAMDLYPVAAGDNRIMYCANPQQVFDVFGTTDWVRLYVYLKRPGAFSVPITVTV